MEAFDRPAMDYWERLNYAQDLINKGQKQEAKDICCEIRLKPDVRVYARARLNLMLAQIHEKGRLARTYASECIDLLDLCRQMRTESTPLSAYEAQVFTRKEDDSKDIIDNVERAKLQRQKGRDLAAQDSLGINQQLEGLQIHQKTEVPQAGQDTVMKDSPSTSTVSGKPQKKWEPVRKIADDEISRSGQLKIEGFLRVGRDYKPVVEYVPLSREPCNLPLALPTVVKEVKGQARVQYGLLSPPPTSELGD